MNLEDFFGAVESNEDLVGVSIDVEDGILCVKHTPTGLCTTLPSDAIEPDTVTWPLLCDILTGVREPVALYHMTRVVGYYSRVENWNKSKIGELRDRHQGKYALDEEQ